MNPDSGAEHSGLSNISRKSDDVAQYYDGWASDYDATLAEWHYEAPKQVAKMLREELGPESQILDAGCGTGLSGAELQAAGFQTVDGMDVSERSLEIAKETGAYRSLEQVDMQRLPLPVADARYDGLACVGVLTYLPESEAILKEFCRVVRPGGRVVVTQRSDIFVERNFKNVLDRLAAEGTIRNLLVTEPRPYLPDNEEFADRILVHYIAWTVE